MLIGFDQRVALARATNEPQVMAEHCTDRRNRYVQATSRRISRKVRPYRLGELVTMEPPSVADAHQAQQRAGARLQPIDLNALAVDRELELPKTLDMHRARRHGRQRSAPGCNEAEPRAKARLELVPTRHIECVVRHAETRARTTAVASDERGPDRTNERHRRGRGPSHRSGQQRCLRGGDRLFRLSRLCPAVAVVDFERATCESGPDAEDLGAEGVEARRSVVEQLPGAFAGKWMVDAEGSSETGEERRRGEAPPVVVLECTLLDGELEKRKVAVVDARDRKKRCAKEPCQPTVSVPIGLVPEALENRSRIAAIAKPGRDRARRCTHIGEHSVGCIGTRARQQHGALARVAVEQRSETGCDCLLRAGQRERETSGGWITVQRRPEAREPVAALRHPIIDFEPAVQALRLSARDPGGVTRRRTIVNLAHSGERFVWPPFAQDAPSRHQLHPRIVGVQAHRKSFGPAVSST